MTGEAHQQLFSAASLVLPSHIRHEKARTLANRLLLCQSNLESIDRREPTWDDRHEAEMLVLEVIIQSFLVSIYRTLPVATPKSHSLQCSVECVEAARAMLQKLVQVGTLVHSWNCKAWTILLNV